MIVKRFSLILRFLFMNITKKPARIFSYRFSNFRLIPSLRVTNQSNRILPLLNKISSIHSQFLHAAEASFKPYRLCLLPSRSFPSESIPIIFLAQGWLASVTCLTHQENRVRNALCYPTSKPYVWPSPVIDFLAWCSFFGLRILSASKNGHHTHI